MSERPLLDFPHHVTRSAAEFYEQHLTNVMTYGIAEMTVKDHEQFLTTAGETLSTDGKKAEEVFPEHFARLNFSKFQIENTRPARLEMAQARSVDNFLTYISDILTQAIITRPDLLKTQEQVTLEEVLSHSSLEEFVRWAAERRVNQLSFKGLPEIAEYVEKRLGMKLHSSDDDWTSLKESVAVRNLTVHRRGVVDERFLWIFKTATVKAGERFPIPIELLASTMKCTMRVVRDFDERVAQKFDIDRVDTHKQAWYLRHKFGPKENWPNDTAPNSS
ncbi:hypothetical protein ACWD4Z_05500 [Streptomyces antibioticus]